MKKKLSSKRHNKLRREKYHNDEKYKAQERKRLRLCLEQKRRDTQYRKKQKSYQKVYYEQKISQRTEKELEKFNNFIIHNIDSFNLMNVNNKVKNLRCNPISLRKIEQLKKYIDEKDQKLFLTTYQIMLKKLELFSRKIDIEDKNIDIKKMKQLRNTLQKEVKKLSQLTERKTQKLTISNNFSFPITNSFVCFKSSNDDSKLDNMVNLIEGDFETFLHTFDDEMGDNSIFSEI